MKLFFQILFLIISGTCTAQLQVLEIVKSAGSNSRTAKTNELLTLQLPFWDDFSTSSGTPDSTLWYIGENVFVNSQLCKNSPTHMAATFDGLLSDGTAYSIGSEYIDATDSLVSQNIDLSAVATGERSTVYLSFYWQAEGNGEMPDEEDSIRLQFYDGSAWITQWVNTGGVDKVSDYFQQVILPVSGDQYFHDQFKFKIQTFSNENGPFDLWHIDYVYLNKNRTAADTSHFDRSLSGSTSKLLSPYFEMPATHFFSNSSQYLTSQSLLATNLDATNIHPLDYTYSLKNLTTGEIYTTSEMGSGNGGNLSPLEYRTIYGPDASSFDLSANELDSQVLETTFYYKTGDKYLFEQVIDGDTVFLPVDLKVNDTIKTTYTLSDYYAYDDGIAEYAAGVNVINGSVAIRYVIAASDTLTHVDIYFPNISPDPTDTGIDIVIWDRLSDSRELARTSYTILSNESLNGFQRIELDRPVIVSDTIYVGFQQFVSDYIGIGFDRNNLEASENIFTNVTDTWQQNTRLDGALMIRPVFGPDTSIYLSAPKTLAETYTIYPNPSSGTLSIAGTYDQIAIYSISGTLVYTSENEDSHDLSNLKDGVYILRIFYKDLMDSKKLIIRK